MAGELSARSVPLENTSGSESGSLARAHGRISVPFGTFSVTVRPEVSLKRGGCGTPITFTVTLARAALVGWELARASTSNVYVSFTYTSSTGKDTRT
jgi:hypothetical protein